MYLPSILVAGVSLVLGGPSAAAASHELEFDVFLDERPIGLHRFLIHDTEGGRQEIRSTARFEVRLLGIAVYRYQHEAREEWRDGCLHRMEATTHDNGERLSVTTGLQADRLQVTLPRAASAQSACASGYAYWNPGALEKQSELLNPQTGRFDAVSFTRVGEESLQRGAGKVPAVRYRLQSPDLVVHLWYSPEGEWLQLESPARGDRKLRYQRRP